MKAPSLSTTLNSSLTGGTATAALAENSSSVTPYHSSTKTNSSSSNDESTNWQNEMLMERLRTKASSLPLRPLLDATKNMRQCILNKQHLMDSTDRTHVSSCLDELQQNIPVTSLEAMVERLEATARQLGLKFTSSPAAMWEVYISCDMFYVEVLLDRDGNTRDVRVEFAGESANTDNAEPGQSCPELIDCLSRCDFKEFTAHLQGFLAMYTLNTSDNKAKLQTQYALKAMETDLSKLFELAEETIGDLYKLVLKSPVGLLLPRRGGHSMRLVYFISPYELLDVKSGRSLPLTASTLCSLEFGQHAQLCIVATTGLHKLQHSTLMQITKGPDGKSLPSFSGLSSANSITIQSVFSLKLPQPLPLSLALAKCISDVTGITLQDISGTDVTEAAGAATSGSTYRQLLELIVLQASEGKLSPAFAERGLFVTLPDQQHCYYFPTQGCHFPGMLVNSIPFTHPTHITSILMLLRAQAAFNTLISSCVRPHSKQDADSAYMFEVTSLSHEFISVTFEHPQGESTATAEIELSDLCNIRCRLHTLALDPSGSNSSANLCSDEFATKVLQRCLSIPVTMRAVMRKATKEDTKDLLPQCGDSVVMSSTPSSAAPAADFNQNNKFVVNDYERRGAAVRTSGGSMGIQRVASGGNSPVIGQQRAANSSASVMMGQPRPNIPGMNVSATGTSALPGASIASVGGGNFSVGKQQGANFFPNSSFQQVKTEPGVEKVSFPNLPLTTPKVAGSQQHFLEDVKAVKVRKRKVMDVDRKGGGSQYSDDIIEVDDPLRDPLEITETKPDVEKLLAYGMETSRRKMDKLPPSYEASTDSRNRRDTKMEKLQNFLAKRRASNDSSATSASSSSCAPSDTGSCDLAALREKVYGAGSAATFAQFNLVPSDDHITPDGRDITKKSKKARINEPQVVEARKSPIVLDLTESEGVSKKSTGSSSRNSSSGTTSTNSSSSSSSSSVNPSVLLKRPGIEIFPIPGNAAAISIPSSITVTPVIKSTSSYSSSDEKYKERKERKDRKDSEKRDKKRRREESPSSSSSSKSKIQVLSNSLKHSSSLPSMDKFRSEGKSSSASSGTCNKPNTPPYQSPSKGSGSSKLPSSPSISKSSSSQHSSKMSYSPTHKSSSSSKTIYSPSQNPHHGSNSSSPKNTSSPKQQGLSPKLSSSGKPSLNTLKSSTSSPSTFSKSSLSPKSSNSTASNSISSSSGSSTSSSSSSKVNSSSSSSSNLVTSTSSQHSSGKERSSTSSPARTQNTNTSNITSSSSSSGSSSLTNSSSKPKSSSHSSSASSADRTKTSVSDSLSSSSKVPLNSSSSSAASNPSFFLSSSSSVASALHDKSTFLLDKAKASPPKNRKGSCLSDIVDKLRAGVSGSTDAIIIGDTTTTDKKDITKVGGLTDLKKDPDKKSDYTLKPLDGLKLSFNKAKSKELKENQMKTSNVSPNSKMSKSSSGLKPGVVSGPACKKVSMSNLPPIPKLNSSTNINSTASVSPLASPLVSAAASTVSSYNSVTSQSYFSSHYKDRNKEKTSSSHEKSSSNDRSRSKDSSSKSDSRRESSSLDKHNSTSVNSVLSATVSANRNKDDSRSGSAQAMKKTNDSDSRASKSGHQKPFHPESSDHKDSSSKSSFQSSKSLESMNSSSSSMLISLLTGSSRPADTKNESSRANHKSDDKDGKSGEYSSCGKLPSSLTSSIPKGGSSYYDEPNEKKNDSEKIANFVSSSASHLGSDALKCSSVNASGLTKSSSNNNNAALSSMTFSNSHSSTLQSSSSRAFSSKIPYPSENLPPPSLPPPPKASGGGNTNCGPPLSPSVSIKIVKSPVPVSSPLNMISPLSVSSQQSPCVIDDDLMDEALMGSRK